MARNRTKVRHCVSREGRARAELEAALRRFLNDAPEVEPQPTR